MCVVQAATCSLDKTVRLWDLRTQQSATLRARTCLRRRPASESVRPLSDRALPQLLLPIADLLVSTALMQCIATHSAHQVPQWSLNTMPFPPRAVGLSRNCMHRRVLRVRWCASTARRAKAPTRNRALALHRARQAHKAEPWCVAISHTLSGLVVSADARGAVGVWRPVAASASAAAQSSSAGEKAPHTVPARRRGRDQGDRREPSGRTRGTGRPAAWLATAGPHGLARMRDAATLGRVRLQGAIVALGYENGVLLVLVSTCRSLATRAHTPFICAAALQPELKVAPSVSLGVRMCSAVRRSGSNKLTTPKYTPS